MRPLTLLAGGLVALLFGLPCGALLQQVLGEPAPAPAAPASLVVGIRPAPAARVATRAAVAPAHTGREAQRPGPPPSARTSAPRLPAPAPPRDPALAGRLAAPDPAALARFEAAERRGDARTLRELVQDERGLLRFGALRAFLELRGGDGLDELDPLWHDADPDLHHLLAAAFGAGAGAAQAASLSERAPFLETPSARLGAAGAVLDALERVAAAGAALPPGAVERAVETLCGLARSQPAEAEAACAALARQLAPARRALRLLAGERSLADAVRLSAAEGVERLGDPAAPALLDTLAHQATDPEVRALAGAYGRQ